MCVHDALPLFGLQAGARRWLRDRSRSRLQPKKGERVMNAHDSSFHKTCHRCHKPMVRHAIDTVDGETIEVFRCENCETLEAEKIEKAAERRAVSVGGLYRMAAACQT